MKKIIGAILLSMLVACAQLPQKSEEAYDPQYPAEISGCFTPEDLGAIIARDHPGAAIEIANFSTKAPEVQEILEAVGSDHMVPLTKELIILMQKLPDGSLGHWAIVPVDGDRCILTPEGPRGSAEWYGEISGDGMAELMGLVTFVQQEQLKKRRSQI